MLKSAYVFKKKCLETENLIGTYLKTARCTARSIDLEDVIACVDKQKKLGGSRLESVPKLEFSSAQKIISDWDDEESRDSTAEYNAREIKTQPVSSVINSLITCILRIIEIHEHSC